MPRAIAPLSIVLALCCASCYHAPDPALLYRLRETQLQSARFLQCEVEVSLESEDGGGEFQGALLVDRGASPRVRLKLFPDLGSAALDLAVSDLRIDVEFPLQDRSFHTALPSAEKLEASMPFFFAVTLAEYFAGIRRDRILGARDDAEGTRLKLSDHSSGVECRAVVDDAGQLVVREFGYGWFVHWTLRVEEDGFRVEAPGMNLRLRMVQVDELDSLPDALFQLDAAAE